MDLPKRIAVRQTCCDYKTKEKICKKVSKTHPILLECELCARNNEQIHDYNQQNYQEREQVNNSSRAKKIGSQQRILPTRSAGADPRETCSNMKIFGHFWTKPENV